MDKLSKFFTLTVLCAMLGACASYSERYDDYPPGYYGETYEQSLVPGSQAWSHYHSEKARVRVERGESPYLNTYNDAYSNGYWGGLGFKHATCGYIC